VAKRRIPQMADVSGEFFLYTEPRCTERKSDVGEERMRILVADCESKVRFALRTLLSRQPGIEVIGEVDAAEELVSQVSATQPDLVLLHWRLPGATPDLLPALRRVCPSLHVIVLSARPEMVHEALAAGAEAFVCKMDPPDRLLAAICLVQGAQDQGDGTCEVPREPQWEARGRDGTGSSPAGQLSSDAKAMTPRLKALTLRGGDPQPVAR
jgi:DNA-binding NarL/FixJ family response regulator